MSCIRAKTQFELQCMEDGKLEKLVLSGKGMKTCIVSEQLLALAARYREKLGGA